MPVDSRNEEVIEMSILQKKTKIKNNESHNKAIVYSCSGCSNLAQMAHNISLTLDGDGVAEMSCISGVMGKVKPMMDLAKSGRPIIAIDGCELSCTKSCLDSSDIIIDYYFKISDLGFDKRDKWDDSLSENTLAIKTVYAGLIEAGINFNQ